jgi:hypothetical protein
VTVTWIGVDDDLLLRSHFLNLEDMSRKTSGDLDEEVKIVQPL